MTKKIKVSLIGDHQVGKTSLVGRFVDDKFSDKYKTTIGVSISKKHIDIDSHSVDIIIWDIQGKAGYINIPDKYLGNAEYAIIVADVTKEDPADPIKEHADKLLAFSPGAEIYIAFNKSDLVGDLADKKERLVKQLEAEDLVINEIYFTSAKENSNVTELFSHIAKDSLNK